MRSWIEFHDSKIINAEADGMSVRLDVDAYVHQWERVDGEWKGTGWAQAIQLILVGSAAGPILECPIVLSSGEIEAGQTTLKNMVPLPFDSLGPARLQLELFTGKLLEFRCSNLTIEPTGGRQYVEDLPADFRPADLDG